MAKKRAKTAARRRSTPARSGARRTQKLAPRRRSARTAKPRVDGRATASRLGITAETIGQALGRTVRAFSDLRSWGDGHPEAIALLECDHRRLEDLLKKGEDATARGVRERTELLDTITAELNAHELIEEEILYPALKPHASARAIVLEGYQEHHVADLLVKELHALPPSDERWDAKFKVLKENIEHHIEEEEGEMFRTARRVLSREELEALGERMAAKKADAMRR
jgi:hypothetical protein